MSHIRSVFKQSSFYFGANVLVQICGFVSFPVWTRLLSKEEYGIFSLMVITITLLTSCSKFGLQHAALRFYAEYKEAVVNGGTKIFYTTIITSNIVISIFMSTIFTLILMNFTGLIDYQNVTAMIYIVAVLGIINSITSIQTTLFRACENARFVSLVSVIKRYGNFIVAVVFVAILWGFQSLFIGWIVTDIVILIWMAIALRKYFTFNIASFSISFLKKAIAYGFPLIGFEICSTLLSIGDRYLIQYYIGEGAVGVYSAGYNLASYAPELISAPLKMAVMPKFINLWERYGEKETSIFLNRIMKYYLMVAIPMVVAMIILKNDITILLASKKFAESSQIIPYIVIPMMIYGGFFIYGAGFFLKKKSVWLAALTFSAATLNVILNIILIPQWGLEGAAFSTLIAYVLLSILIFNISRKVLQVDIEISSLVKYSLSAVIMGIIIFYIDGNDILGLLIKVIVGFFSYSVALYFLDSEVRKLVISIFNR